MEIKVQCDCGARYSFDVEPVNGRMPVPVACPKCGADGTGRANEIIAHAQAHSSTPAPARVRIASASAAPTAAPASEAAAESQMVTCNRHRRTPAVSECVVCHKPICPECMQQFGYLCSVQCRYRADQQRIKVPVYEGQRHVAEARQWRKVGLVAGVAALCVAGLIGFWLWYEFAGSSPRPHYSLRFSQNEQPFFSRFVDKDHILVVNPGKVLLHDIKKGQDVWATPWKVAEADPAEIENNSSTENGSEFRRVFSRHYAEEPRVFLLTNEVWLCLSTQLMSFDLASGTKKKNLSLPGRATEFSLVENGLLVLSEVSEKTNAVTRIDLASPAVRTDFVSARQSEFQQIRQPAEPVFTAGASMSDDPMMESPLALRKFYSATLASGQSALQVDVRLVEANVVAVQAMKRPTGKSALNATTSAATSAGVVAEEVFNEIKRSRTGGTKQVDYSKYSITLRRLPDLDSAWTGEVVGRPGFYTLKTLNLLTAGKVLYFFDKQNRKIGETQLAHPVSEEQLDLSDKAGPCCESGSVLYFFDQGVLTAFDLPSCQVRWRLTSVGISNVEPDGKGHLYVSTTSASPESIQYSEEINITDSPVDLLVKVEAASGKILWKSRRKADFRLAGKFVYAMNTQVSGHPLVSGAAQAFGSGFGGSALRIYRINPSSGKEMWESFQQEPAEQIDFCANRILLRMEGEVRILKFLAF